MPTCKGPLIVELRNDEEEEEPVWTVYPTAGICIKFKEAHFPTASSIASGPSSSKFFINLAHCTELPAPNRYAELDEDQVAQLLGEDPDAFRIPICVGELDRSAEDHSGETVSKVDVLVNSNFFHKRITESEFFRQLAIRIICQALEEKHSIRVDIAKQIILRNKKCIGELGAQRIRKRPAAVANIVKTTKTGTISSISQTITQKGGTNGHGKVTTTAGNIDTTNDEQMEQGEDAVDGANESDQMPLLDIDEVEGGSEKRRPRNFKVQIVEGTYADVRIRTRDQQGELVTELNRLTLKMNDDRIVVIVDSSAKCADFFLPVKLKDDQVDATFDPNSATLHLKCPIDWQH